jgi:hypothetical protein
MICHIMNYVVLILLNQMSLSIKVIQLVLFKWRQVILNAIFCIKMVLFHRSYGHKNICKLSICDNLIEIFTKSTILHISYVSSTLVWKVCKFQGESLSSLWLITCWKHNIALCSLYEFFPLGFTYKFFNEAISTQGYVLSSIFPIEVFGGWYWNIWYIVLFSLCKFFLLRFLI